MNETFIQMMCSNINKTDDISDKIETAKNLRREIENAVNCFGFSPKEYAEPIMKSATGSKNNMLFCVNFIRYEVESEKWIDGRNEYSQNYCVKISELESFKIYYDKLTNSSNTDDFMKKLMRQISQNLHRTNLQTLASYVFYCLCEYAPKGVSDDVKQVLCDGKEIYNNCWRMPMI